MNKRFATIAVASALLFLPTASFAQPNSVLLEDGIGNLLSSHSSIQAAYDAIPGTLTQAYGIQITNGYTTANETFPVTFVNKPGASAAHTIKIYVMQSVLTMDVNYDGGASSAFIFDDADWITICGRSGLGGVALRINSPSSPLSFPAINFINGACNNNIDSTRFAPVITNTSTVPIINFGTSPVNVSGNSDNRIHYCTFNNAVNGIHSEGTVNNPNDNILINNNTIFPSESAVRTKAGTGKVIIDSNYIALNEIFFQPEKQAIVCESLSDSVLITRNRIRSYLMEVQQISRGIFIKNTTGGNAYTFIANNFIYFQTYDNLLGLRTDPQTYVAGIEYDGSYPVQADIYHNTVRVMEEVMDTVTAPSFSACFKKEGDNVNNIFNIRNNIFSMERHGGQDPEHLSMLLTNTSGSLTIDYNNYNDITGQYVKYNNVLYSTFAAYQAAIGGGNEANSNSAIPEFTGPTDFHVYGSMVSNPVFYGVTIPGITTDTENDPRTNPYKGCDEYAVHCTSQSSSVNYAPNNICEGDTFLIATSSPWTGNGNTWQWQSRPAGTTVPFADIPGATHYVELMALTQSTDIRVERSCADNSFTLYSNTHTVGINPLPTASQILETHTGLIYNFSTNNPLYITLFQWDFGDGSPLDSTGLPQHEYADTGTYTVTLIISNNCGSDTLTYTITPPVVGLDNTTLTNSISLYPNPAGNEVKITSANNTLNNYVVYNITGSQVMCGSPAKNIIKLDTSDLPPGIYTIRLNTDKGILHRRLQIIR